MKKYALLISLGVINLLHASMHIVQFIQSIMLMGVSIEVHDHGKENFIEHLLHNPILNIIWGLIAIVTLYLGVRDFIHHKSCKHK